MFWDADVWISSIKKPIEYYVPNDLVGYTIGGRSGYVYKGVNKLVDNHKIKRLDSHSDNINYQKLMNSEVYPSNLKMQVSESLSGFNFRRTKEGM